MRHLALLTFILAHIAASASGWDTTTTIQEKITAYNLNKKNIVVYIYKLDHKLALKIDSITLREYKCVFGANPVDDKEFEGDYCTPEGVFHIKAKYPHPQWSKFIWIDYPNEESWKKFDANMKAHKISSRARIGGNIGIHGVPPNKNRSIDRGINWTLGCISLKTYDVDKVYYWVEVGTKIVISK